MGDVRPSDRTIADIAGRNQGWYSEDIHRRTEPDASERYITAHVRRLEAVRRATGGIERMEGGMFAVGDGYLDKAAQYERQRTLETPVSVEVLSQRPVTDLVRRQAYTWLDQQLMEEKHIDLSETGFGGEIRDALHKRLSWLETEGLVRDRANGTFTYPSDLKSVLSRREIEAEGRRLSDKFGMSYGHVSEYERFDGTLKGKAELSSGNFAIIERSHDFVLVPWRDTLEKQIGKELSGVMRGRDIDWSFGRSRGLDIGM